MIRPTPNLGPGDAAGLSWPRLQPHRVPHWRLGSVAISRIVGHTPSRHIPPQPSRAMLHHSLELALEEADGRVQDEQLLRRANVSPYFSSCRNPHGQDLSTRQVEELQSVPQLNLDLGGSSAFVEESSSGSLSRALFWHDFTLDADSTTTASTESSAAAGPGAWALFLEGKAPNGLPVVYPLKTPTTQPTFPGFFEDGSPSTVDDPKVLSPTHIDKKVLVSENDLKLFSATSRANFCGRRAANGHRGPLATPQSARSRIKREKLFPQEASESPSALYGLPPPRSLRMRDNRMFLDQRQQPEALVLRRPPELSPYPYEHHAEASSNISLLDPHRKQIHSTIGKDLFPLAAGDVSFAQQPKRQRLHVPPELVQREYARVFQQSISQQLPPPVGPPKRRPSRRRIGIYTPEARRERIRRFHEKRKLRVFHKRIKYDCRKRLANACPRVKGRFVRKEPLAEAATHQTDPSSEENAA